MLFVDLRSLFLPFFLGGGYGMLCCLVWCVVCLCFLRFVWRFLCFACVLLHVACGCVVVVCCCWFVGLFFCVVCLVGLLLCAVVGLLV